MKPLAYVAFALLLAAVQASLLRWVGGGSFSLALVTCCVVYVGLHGGNVDGSISAAGVGYVLDLMAGTPKGLLTFLCVLLFLLVRAVSAAVDVRGRAPFGLISGAGALFLSLGSVILLRIATAELAPGAPVAGRMIVEALLTGILAPVVFEALKRVDALFQREESGLLR